MSRLLTALTALLTLACDPRTADDTGPIAGEIARIEVATASRMVTPDGEPACLRATAYDATDQVVDAALTWSAEDETVLTVDAHGCLTPVAEAGSTWVQASAGEVRSDRVIAFVADPVDGALLFEDRQVVEGPELLDETPTSIVGTHLRVVLADMEPPALGSLVIPLEDTPAQGRVLAAEGVAGGVALELEILPLDALFDRLSLHIDGWPSDDALEPGVPTFTDFELGPFECTSESGTELTDPGVSYDLVPSLAPRVELDLGAAPETATIALEGSLTLELEAGFELPDDWNGTVTCEVEIVAPSFPLPGVAALMVQVPLGVGFELHGSLSGLGVEIGVEASAGIEAVVGYAWTEGEGWTDITDIHEVCEVNPIFDVPDLEADLRLEAYAWAYAWVHLEASVARLDFLTAELVTARVGPRQDLHLASALAQAQDEGYAADYGLDLALEVAAGSSVDAALDLLGLGDDLHLSAETAWALAESPHGSFAADPASAEVGEEVTFTVTLEDLEYLGLDNIDEVVIYRLVDDELVEQERLEGSVGTTEYTWAWTPTEEDTGTQTFVAFITSTLLPGVPLEVAADGAAAVPVGSWLIQLSVTDVHLATDATGDDLDADEVIADYMNVLQANIIWCNAEADYLLSLGQYSMAEYYWVIAENLGQELIWWAEFYYAVTHADESLSRLMGGDEADDFGGQLSDMVGILEPGMADSAAGLTWDSAPEAAADHTFIATAERDGEYPFLILWHMKAVETADQEDPLLLSQQFLFIAAYQDDPDVRLTLDGDTWVASTDGSFPSDTDLRSLAVGEEHRVDVYMDCLVVPATTPAWEHTDTMVTGLFGWSFELERVAVEEE
ncbi:MAG: hypothetical protein ABIO70_16770 [Pseudomonadota bacterium]